MHHIAIANEEHPFFSSCEHVPLLLKQWNRICSLQNSWRFFWYFFTSTLDSSCTTHKLPVFAYGESIVESHIDISDGPSNLEQGKRLYNQQNYDEAVTFFGWQCWPTNSETINIILFLAYQNNALITFNEGNVYDRPDISFSWCTIPQWAYNICTEWWLYFLPFWKSTSFQANDTFRCFHWKRGKMPARYSFQNFLFVYHKSPA